MGEVNNLTDAYYLELGFSKKQIKAHREWWKDSGMAVNDVFGSPSSQRKLRPRSATTQVKPDTTAKGNTGKKAGKKKAADSDNVLEQDSVLYDEE